MEARGRGGGFRLRGRDRGKAGVGWRGRRVLLRGFCRFGGRRGSGGKCMAGCLGFMLPLMGTGLGVGVLGV